MKFITTDNYLLMVDDYFQRPKTPFVRMMATGSIEVIDNVLDAYYGGCPILAHLPLNGAPKLEGVDLLPPLEDDTCNLCEGSGYDNNRRSECPMCNGKGKVSQDRKYSEEDIIKLLHDNDVIQSILDQNTGKAPLGTVSKVVSNFINSLNTPKLPIGFEPEWEVVSDDNNYGSGEIFTSNKKEVIKTITLPDGRKQWVGSYKF